ncbi:diacylglycerol kinase family protein [Paenibacillus sp. GCM10023252]|uniref:diacylglycerol kinase family protein n=1 Tax=Paenibacillus sp. GCM10023252 TaxID=3252649 RepID=UPI003615A113
MRRFTNSFRYAASGVYYAISSQRHMRIHLAASLIVIILGLLLNLKRMEWAILLLTMAGVIASEMMNTAVEKTVDLVTSEYHPLAKAAKDVAAGAVLIAALFAVIIGLLILGPPLWRLCGLPS